MPEKQIVPKPKLIELIMGKIIRDAYLLLTLRAQGYDNLAEEKEEVISALLNLAEDLTIDREKAGKPK